MTIAEQISRRKASRPKSSAGASDLDHARALRRSFEEASAVNRSGRVFLGSVLLISAAGLWLVPVADGDMAMRLIKLVVSLVFAGLGAMFISTIAEIETDPELVIDPEARELRVIRRNPIRRRAETSRYAFDDLTEFSLGTHVFKAKMKSDGQDIQVPVSDTPTHQALRKVLATIA